MNKCSVIGLMSGSSLDGLDLACCDFVIDAAHKTVVSWQLKAAATLPFTKEWQAKLKAAPRFTGKELWQCHTDLGHYLGKQVKVFKEEYAYQVDFVASHGHTVFHFPEQQMTCQIGDGAAIAAVAQLPVIDQFRMQDIATGGQGAPLAPLADLYLFPKADLCLNLGGIANITLKTPTGLIAFDIGGANQLLNTLSEEAGQAYDKGGQMAAKGKLLPDLFEQANSLPFFEKAYPKSLGNDWVQEKLIPLFQTEQGSLNDRLFTAVEHIVFQIKQQLNTALEKEGLSSDSKMMMTGGGAFNTYLCNRLTEALQPLEIIETSKDIIAYKEAILMALAGAFRWYKIPNIFPSVTGATRAVTGGAIHWF